MARPRHATRHQNAFSIKKMKKRVFIKASRERHKKWEKLILCPEVTERHEHAICPQSAFFIKKTENAFLFKKTKNEKACFVQRAPPKK